MEARNWKWMLPGGGVFVFAVLGFYLIERLSEYPAYVAFGLAAVLFIQATAGFKAYYRTLETDLFVRRQNALADTAENRMATAMSAMHPGTAQIFVEHTKITWLVDEMDENEVCEWWLKEDPRINARFVEWLLANSNDYSLMPQNRVLNDGAKNWSATVTDRLMYQCFVEVLKRRRMLTEAHGNQPGLWISPWTPRTVAKRFGIPYEEAKLEENE